MIISVLSFNEIYVVERGQLGEYGVHVLYGKKVEYRKWCRVALNELAQSAEFSSDTYNGSERPVVG